MTRLRLAAIAVAAGLPLAAANDAQELEEVIVRAEASVVPSQGALGSLAVVESADIELVRANHPNELLVRVPGVWISRGSGQEHLTAIRSGVLTGAGACGEFLLLENGIPIRPAGFCNVNNLFEMNTEQAAAVEVVRGPASALFGGNALHGVINVVSATPGEGWRASGSRASLEAGPYEYVQARVAAGGETWRLQAASTSSGGYRDATGYGQHKITASESGTVGDWQAVTTATATLLNQETGGFVRGYQAYDGADRSSNPNPEAYRDAWSGRVSTALRRDLSPQYTLTITPYLRRSSMTFLQHWLPGQPFEQNAQTSGGALLRLGFDGAWRWTAGAVVEAFAARLLERQDTPTRGSAFLVATRPAGIHYDYRVDGLTLAAFYDLGVDLNPALELVASARVERNAYKLRQSAPCGQYARRRLVMRLRRLLVYTTSGSRRRLSELGRRLGFNWSIRRTWPSTRWPGRASDRRRPPNCTACSAASAWLI